MRIRKWVFLFSFLISHSLYADEIRPAYLEVNENTQNTFSLILKVPAKGTQSLPIKTVLPKECIPITPIRKHFLENASIERWSIKCEGGLVGKQILFNGLNQTNTEVLLRLTFFNGSTHSILLTPNKTSYVIPKEASSLQVIQTYIWLGITHILLGFDHLLFIFSLLLIVKNMRRLFWTITAFTFAHSITLVSATLGFIDIPQKPVEAVIALSILFLAVELIHEKQGRIGLTSRFPWLVAFIFGLLHGFGFAGALAEIGLPQQAITLALIFFNVGVELGQIMFVSLIAIFIWILSSLGYATLLERLKTYIVYVIGILSSFWLIERLLSF